jgi:hypothetical protein
MRKTARRATVLALLTTLALSTALAQGPLQKKVTYTINVVSAVDVGEYRLPAGRYILYQINTVDPNRFALYKDDMQDSPVAVLHTTRVEVPENRQGDDVTLSLEIDETDRTATPTLKGWVVPGVGGWEIVRVDAPKGGLLRPGEHD